MDKGAIKKYAIWARRELIFRVSQRAALYDITESGYGDPEADSVRGKVLTGAEKRQRRALIRQIGQKGYEEVMEEVAYTWFNRFCALRFMEVNGYLPTHVRVFTDDENEFKPQILAEAINMELDGLDMERVYALKNGNENEELFKYLIIIQCNALNKILPGMFQRIEDYTELLFPDNLLREGSAAEQMIALIPEEDWKDQVQIIGWLYQYYNSEKKDEVFAALKKNVKITKENIPAATQLFTPDWIVRYMVENSLGRLWVEGHPNEELKGKWKYYLEEARQEPEVERQLAEIRKEYGALNPEDLRCIDPCMGSGHILCYMFDVLMQIYQAHGVQTRDAVKSIVENNLFGLDIDDRAAQLAYFSVMMKGRQYDSRFFRRGAQPNVYSPKGYEEGREFGALLTVERLEDMPQEPEEFSLFDENYEDKVNRWRFRAVLARKYHVVCTNPPYMGASNMNSKLGEFVKKNYPDEKSDMFACFIARGFELVKPTGYNCMVTMQSWMFLSGFEKMRKKILSCKTISDLMHMENMVMGIAFGTAVSVFRNGHIVGYKGTYNHIKLKDIQDDEPIEFPVQGNRFAQVSSDNFSKIPGVPVAYWVSEKFIEAYSYKIISEYGFARSGLQTGNNDLYLKYWYEVQINKIAFGMRTKQEYLQTGKKWTPQIKGGEYRKWYGNFDYIVNWLNDGAEIRKCDGCRLNAMGNEELFFKQGITWSHTTSSVYGARYLPSGYLFNVEAPTLFVNEDMEYYFLGFLNSNVAQKYLTTLNSTMHYLVGNIMSLPIRVSRNIKSVKILVDENINLSQEEWDSFEISWDFKKHPLI
ncbi:MAG: BREX-1 system adenine-specific DNA-methyltransferase PglX [Hungatella sp.]|nr:BREX-1 system adenine-specific DNA-methyltransferase PglX [Hungatella sp.]